jgi:hypothetical protein
MKPTVKLSQKGPGAQIAKDIADLAKLQVYVGIPEAASSRPKEKVTNAELLYIHTHGSPLKHIPARPVLEPMLMLPDNKAAITADLKQAGVSALNGKMQEAVKFMKIAGMDAANRAKSFFTDPRNNWAPNAPSTIRRKGSDRPMINLGELRKSITWVLAKVK